MALDPMNPGGMGNPMQSNPRQQGWFDFLKSIGYSGEMNRPDMRQYAQGLRQDGQHPRMDYRNSQYWQGPAMGGQMPQMGQMGSFGQPQRPPLPQLPQAQPWNQPPHTMGPQIQGIAQGEPYPMQNGLAALSRRPNPLAKR